MLPSLDYPYLVLGSNSCVNALVPDIGDKLLVGVLIQLRALDGLTHILENTYLLGDSGGGNDVVAGYHYRLYSRRLTLGNGLLALNSRRVHHSDEAHIFKALLVVNGKLGCVEFLAGEAEDTQSLRGELLHLSLYLLLLLVGDVHSLDEDVRRALGVHYVLPVDYVQGAHKLSVGVKGYLADALVIYADLVVVKLSVSGVGYQSGLGGVAYLGAVLYL